MQSSLYQIEAFMRLLHEVEKTKRVSRRPDETEQTSTAEHTFELALLCWYIVSVEKLDINMGKVLQYALAHDLIEAYAGDTYIYDKEAQKTKASREREALNKIKNTFTEFPELISAICEYEERETPESKFVYAVDKLIDPLNFSMEETQSIWKDYGVSYEDLRAYKDPKIALNDTVSVYWRELIKKLERDKDFYFPNK